MDGLAWCASCAAQGVLDRVEPHATCTSFPSAALREAGTAQIQFVHSRNLLRPGVHPTPDPSPSRGGGLARVEMFRSGQRLFSETRGSSGVALIACCCQTLCLPSGEVLSGGVNIVRSFPQPVTPCPSPPAPPSPRQEDWDWRTRTWVHLNRKRSSLGPALLLSRGQLPRRQAPVFPDHSAAERPFIGGAGSR